MPDNLELKTQNPEPAFSMSSGKRVENVFLILLVSILLYTTWVWAGIRPSFHRFAYFASWLILLVLVFLPVILAAWSEKVAMFKRTLSDLFTNPFFYLGFLFLAYLGVQWWNSGRTLVLDQSLDRWIYSAPPMKDWPSSFSRPEAFQIITWFFPAWVIALVLRSSWLRGKTLHRLLLLLAYNAGLLALFGVVQFATHTTFIYWTTPLDCHFFASFGYSNHVAPFFLLAGGLTAGLLYWELFGEEGSSRRKIRLVLLSLCLVLDLISACLSISRAGIIFSGCFVLLASIYGLCRAWKTLTPAARLNMAAMIVGVTGVIYFVVAGFGSDLIVSKFMAPFAKVTEAQTFYEKLDIIAGGRGFLDVAAYNIWKDNVWLGIGAWGFRYLLALYISPEMWGQIDEGKSNVHCDPLQFLAEFGVVGAGLLFLAVGYLLVCLLKKMSGHNALVHMSTVGLVMVVLLSLIDLPFRCPAIIYTWLTVLIAVPRMEARKF